MLMLAFILLSHQETICSGGNYHFHRVSTKNKSKRQSVDVGTRVEDARAIFETRDKSMQLIEGQGK